MTKPVSVPNRTGLRYDERTDAWYAVFELDGIEYDGPPDRFQYQSVRNPRPDYNGFYSLKFDGGIDADGDSSNCAYRPETVPRFLALDAEHYRFPMSDYDVERSHP